MVCTIRFDEARKAIFVFPLTNEVLDAAREFDSDGAIPARRFSRAVSVIRDRLFELKPGNLEQKA